MTASCTQPPRASSVAIRPIPAGDARLWFYRDGGPRETQERPYLRLNGQIAGISEPNGTFYRDVAPGHYTVTVDSYISTYGDQFAEFNLGAGQEAFVKVLSMREKVGGGDGNALRTRFFTEFVPPDIARPMIAGTPFYGGS